jgi:hypothetical protein
MKDTLDTLAGRGRAFISRWSLQRDLRFTCREALLWLLAGPALLLFVQTVLFLVSGRTMPLTIWAWLLASIAGPILFVVARVIWLAAIRRIDRRTSLGLYDTQLDSKDRLVTADEFLAVNLQSAPMDRFKQAAIDDAADHLETAMRTPLAPKPLPPWQVTRRSLAAVPAAALVILAAMWLGFASRVTTASAPDAAAIAARDLQTLPDRIASLLLNSPRPRPRPDRKPVDERPDATDQKAASDASAKSTRSDQDAEGQSHAGGQANSRSSSQAMSSSGTPSNQQTPSKAVEDDLPQDQKANPPNPPKKQDGKKPEQQATSATSGQGQSKSSSSDMNKIPATDQPDRAGANKDDGKDEDGIQDEVEEEKTAGVERPSLRKNKPPVDRNLSTRPTGDQPNPNANGRSGPGGRKKTRGVPAMILGVPTPDRIQGMSNPGRSKVTQEHSTPKEEPQAARDAEARRAREAAFGHVEHPLLTPWMQSLIEKYFTQIRGKK